VIRDGEVEDSRFVSHQLGFFFLNFFYISIMSNRKHVTYNYWAKTFGHRNNFGPIK
jgi:hypothetical protein